MNTVLLNKIADVIERHPQRHKQWVWILQEDDEYVSYNCNLHVKMENIDHCNTTACIAGWAVVLSTEEEVAAHAKSQPYHISDLAEKLLGLTPLQAKYLFNGGWEPPNVPKELRRIAKEGKVSDKYKNHGDVFQYCNLHIEEWK